MSISRVPGQERARLACLAYADARPGVGLDRACTVRTNPFGRRPVRRPRRAVNDGPRASSAIARRTGLPARLDAGDRDARPVHVMRTYVVAEIDEEGGFAIYFAGARRDHSAVTRVTSRTRRRRDPAAVAEAVSELRRRGDTLVRRRRQGSTARGWRHDPRESARGSRVRQRLGGSAEPLRVSASAVGRPGNRRRRTARPRPDCHARATACRGCPRRR